MSTAPLSTNATGDANAVVHAPAPRRMTHEEFMALPDDGRDRWLLGGILHEGHEGNDVTKRNPHHSVSMVRIAYWLQDWVQRQPKPQGAVLAGEAGFRLSADDTVGVDVAYVEAALADSIDEGTGTVAGIPTLVVEILSPYDTQKDVYEKTETYLKAGVDHVWVVDPHAKTVVVYRKDRVPKLYSVEDEIDAEPHLPGFRAPVKEFFLRG